MKYFLYDEKNKRLVLVDEIFPTLTNRGYDTHPMPTPNNEQERIYNSKYVWENIELKEANDGISLDHEAFFVKDNVRKKILHLPSNDAYLIFGGAYEYTGKKKEV